MLFACTLQHVKSLRWHEEYWSPVSLSMRYSLFKRLRKSRTHVDLHRTEPVPQSEEGRICPVFGPLRSSTNSDTLSEVGKNPNAGRNMPMFASQLLEDCRPLPLPR
jgi:hypothetical protein